MTVLWKMLLVVLFAGPIWAEDWKMRDGDQLFETDALEKRLSGRELVFYDDGRSVYGEDGRYHYTYGGGGTWHGEYAVQDGSVVCVTFVTGSKRCDRLVENAGRLILLTEQGDRFPVRP